jgi:hypothetical protein
MKWYSTSGKALPLSSRTRARHRYTNWHWLPPAFEFLSCLPVTMSPVRIVPPVRVPTLGSRSRSSAICIVCIRVRPHNARQWDALAVRDMCRLCAMNQVEETAQRRAHLVARLAARAENEERVRSGLSTICIPPQIHHICTFCHTDYLLPLTGNQLDRCQPCQTYKDGAQNHIQAFQLEFLLSQ